MKWIYEECLEVEMKRCSPAIARNSSHAKRYINRHDRRGVHRDLTHLPDEEVAVIPTALPLYVAPRTMYINGRVLPCLH